MDIGETIVAELSGIETEWTVIGFEKRDHETMLVLSCDADAINDEGVVEYDERVEKIRLCLWVKVPELFVGIDTN